MLPDLEKIIAADRRAQAAMAQAWLASLTRTASQDRK